MANSKIEIINHFDNLINQVDIDIEESLEKYNEKQVIGDLICYKSFKKKKEKNINLFEMSESSLNRSYENELPLLKEEKKLERKLLKDQKKENPDDLEYDKIYKTVDLWSEETKVVDYLNQVRMRTIEELREAQKEALDSYKSQSDDSKSQLNPKFYFQVRYTQTYQEEWIFKLFTFVTDFNMSLVEITLLEELINAREDDFEDLYGHDLYDDLHLKMILIGLFQKFFFENLNSEKFPIPVISVRKRDLLAIKQISFDYNLYGFYLTNSSSIDLSNLESLDFLADKIEQIDIDGLASLESLCLGIYSFDSLSLNNLASLRNLEIYLYYRDNEHFRGLFYNLPSIEYLTLNITGVYSYISDLSLDHLVNLKSLSLSGTLHKNFNFDLFKNICNHLEILSVHFENFSNRSLAKLFYGHQFPILKSFSMFLCYLPREITKLEKKLFDRFPTLQSLTINNCVGLRVIDFNVFSNLKELISLDLSKSYIDSLDVMLFSGLINLKYLYLSSNKLERIDSKQFSSLTNLRLLDLSYNKLCNFDLTILDYTKNIVLIDLTYNKIANKDEILNRIKGSNIKFDF